MSYHSKQLFQFMALLIILWIMFSQQNLPNSTGLFEGEPSLIDNSTVSFDEAGRNLSQTDLDCLENYEDKKQSISFDLYDHRMLQEIQTPYFKPVEIKNTIKTSLLCNRVQGGYQAPRQLSFLCFGDRRVELKREQIDDYLCRKCGDDRYSTQKLKCSVIIEELVRKLCVTELKFEPMQIKVQTFSLFIVEGEEKRQTIINDHPFETIYNYSSVCLARAPRNAKLTKTDRDITNKNKDFETIEILSPDQRDLIEVLQRNLTISDLKEKIAAYYYQIMGRIILVSYFTFKIVDNKRKIGEVEKTIEIYQQKPRQFYDRTFVKKNQVRDKFNDKNCIIEQEELLVDSARLEEVTVSEGLLHGRLSLGIEDNKLIERYSGGVMGYLQNDRVRSRSLLTLTALKIMGQTLFLEFTYKDGSQVIGYQFTTCGLMRRIVESILIIARKYSHNLQMIGH